MVKRWEKMGRKPKLQLGGNSKSTNCQPANSSSAVFRGLTQYADSDDDDEGNDEHVSSVGEPKKIDLEVADFLKEIDALAPNEIPESSEAEAKDDLENKDEGTSQAEVSENQSSSSSSLSSAAAHQSSWQQCYDEQTGYTYFWNVHTNEVTWETPEDVKRLVGSSDTNEAASSGTENMNHERAEQSNGISKMSLEDLSQHQPPKKRRKNRNREEQGLTGEEEDGKIIPITCYGPSSSDEEVPEVTVAIPKKRRLLASQQRKAKEALIGPILDLPTAEMGPHLPSELNGCSETSQSVPETANKTCEISATEDAATDSRTRNEFSENLDQTDSATVSTCSIVPLCGDSIEDESVVTNGLLDHGEALPSVDPCYGSSVSMAEDSRTCIGSENQQPDSNSASENSLSVPLSDDPPFSEETATSVRVLSDSEVQEERNVRTASPFQMKSDSTSSYPGSSRDISEMGAHCEDVDVEQMETEPDSTTRKDCSRQTGPVTRSICSEKVAQNKALQRLLQYKETNSQSSATDTRFVGAEISLGDQQEVSSADDSSPDLPTPSTDSSYVVYNRIRFVKSEEVLDLNTINNIPCGEDAANALPLPAAEVSSIDALSDDHFHDRPSPRPEVREEDGKSLPDDEIDLEEIERALDSALERNKNANLSAPSTSKNQSTTRDRSRDESSLPPPSTSNSQNFEMTLEELSNLLFSKLAVLGVGKMDFSALALLHVQLETRYTDWQLGHLSSNYFMERLKEADILLKQYESKATPKGWTCNWDRENGRYFYVCNRTGRAQWEFPVLPSKDEEASSSQQSTPTKRSVHPSTAGQHPLVTSSTAEELFRFAAKARQVHPLPLVLHPTVPAEETAEVEPQRSISPTPPQGSPPIPQLSKSPPPPPPDSTEEESKTPDVDMEIEDGNSKESEDNPSSSSVETSFQPPTNVLYLEREQSAFYEALGDTWLPEAPADAPQEPVVVISRAPSVASTVSTSDVRPYDLSNSFSWGQNTAYGYSEVNGGDALSMP